MWWGWGVERVGWGEVAVGRCTEEHSIDTNKEPTRIASRDDDYFFILPFVPKILNFDKKGVVTAKVRMGMEKDNYDIYSILMLA